MQKCLTYSSKKYLLKLEDVEELEDADEYNTENRITILLGDFLSQVKDRLLSGRHLINEAKKNKQEFVEVEIAYYSLNKWLSLLVSFIKPLKRKFYVEGNNSYFTPLKHFLSQDLKRGDRNEQNAYAWTGKRWKMSEEDRNLRYSKLYNSLKSEGYRKDSPVMVLCNRSCGVRDQMLQGHHRLSICEELNIENISVRFFGGPQAPSWLKLVDNIITFGKGLVR